MPLPADDPAERLSPRQLQERAVRGALWTAVHVLVSVPLGFAVNVVVARVLGVVDWGRLAVLSAAFELATSLVIGLIATGSLQFGAKAHAAGRVGEAVDVLRSAATLRLLLEVPVLSAVVVVASSLPTALVVAALVGGVLVPALGAGSAISLGIENRTARGAQIVLVSSILVQALVLAALAWVRTPDAVWAARLCFGGIVGVGSLLVAAPRYRRASLAPRWPLAFPVGFWRFALPTALSTLVWTFVSSRSEVFALMWLSSAEAVGIFALAFGLAQHLFSPAQALIGPLLPAVSGLAEVEPAALARGFARTVRVSSTVAALVLATLVPAVSLLVPVLYGSDFLPAAPVVLVLGAALALLVVAEAVVSFVLARLGGGRLLSANLVGLAVDVVLMLALIPPWSVWGAVAANVCGTLARFAVLFAAELRATGIRLGGFLGWCRPVGLAVVAAALAWLLGRYAASQAGAVPAAALAGMTGIVLLHLLLRLTRGGLTPTELDAIAGAVGARPGRLVRRWGRLLAHVPDAD